jgi:serine protease Do
VAETQPGGPAAAGGILVGDVITSLNGDAITDSSQLLHRLSGIRPGLLVDLGVMRNGSEQSLAVTLGKAPGSRGATMLLRQPRRQGQRLALISA